MISRRNLSVYALLCGLVTHGLCFEPKIVPKLWISPECDAIEDMTEMIHTALGRVHVRAHYAIQALDNIDKDANVKNLMNEMIGNLDSVSNIKNHYIAIRNAAKRGIWTGSQKEFAGVEGEPPNAKYVGVSKSTDIAFICNFSHLKDSSDPALFLDTWKGSTIEKKMYEGDTVACLTTIEGGRSEWLVESPQLFVWWPVFLEKYKPKPEWNLLTEELWDWALANPISVNAKKKTPTSENYPGTVLPFDIVSETPEHVIFHELLHGEFAGHTRHGEKDGYGWDPASKTTMDKSTHTEWLAILAHVLEAYARLGITVKRGRLIDTRELHERSGVLEQYTMPEGMDEYPEYLDYRKEWKDE